MLKLRDLVTGALVVAAGLGLGFALGKGEGGSRDVARGDASADPIARTMVTALGDGGGGRASAYRVLSSDRDVLGFRKLRQQMALVTGAELDEIPELIELVGDVSVGSDLLQKMLVKRWVEGDAEGALAAVLEGRPAVMRELGNLVIDAIAQEDTDACWAMLRSHRHGRDGERFLTRYLSELGDWEPDLALDRAAELDSIADQSILEPFLDSLAASEPMRVLAFAKERPGVMGRGVTVGSGPELGNAVSSSLGSWDVEPYRHVAQRWASSDPDTAVQWFEGLAPSERAEVVEPLVVGWVARDPTAAVAYAFEAVPEADQQDLFDRLLAGQLFRLSFEDQLRMAEVGEGLVNGRARFVANWLKVDAAAAAEWAAGRPDGERQVVMKRAAAEWALWWADSAMEGIASISDPEFRGLATDVLVQQAVRQPERWPLEDMAPALRAAVEEARAGGGER